MTDYRIENINTGAVIWEACESAKEAHEYGSAKWPGEVVEVFTESEWTMVSHWVPQHNQLMDLLDGVTSSITQDDANKCLNLLTLIGHRLRESRAFFQAEKDKKANNNTQGSNRAIGIDGRCDGK